MSIGSYTTKVAGGAIAGGASGLSRIGTMAGGQPDGFYVKLVSYKPCTIFRLY